MGSIMTFDGDFSLSVIIPAHKGDEALYRCLSSLSQTSPPPAEIILVEDGGGNGIAEMAEEFGYQFCSNPIRSGPARARNLGARKAQGTILFFIDSDVIIPADTMEKVHYEFVQNPNLAAVFGSYDDAPGADNFLSQYRNLLHYYIHQNSNENATTFWGACGAMRREVFEGLGGFDERYGQPSIEDIELGSRAKKAGYEIRLAKTLQIKHLKRYSPISLLKSDFFDRALPWTELLLSNRRLFNDLNLRLSHRFSIVLVFCFILSLIASIWQPMLLGVSALLIPIFLAVNFPLYRFFFSKRGLWFMIRVLPWHCVYYVICGLAFAVGLFRAPFFKRGAVHSFFA